MFRQPAGAKTIEALSGRLGVGTALVPAGAGAASVTLNGRPVQAGCVKANRRARFELAAGVVPTPGGTLALRS
jgi:hypothetical protein